MVELKDFITTMQTNMDSYILDEASKGVLKYSIKLAVDVNEERCKEWIKQAMKIETFTKEQIEDLKVRNLFEKLEKENKQLKQQLVEKDKEIEEYKTQIKEFCGTKLAKLIHKKEQEIRKQVCNEIKNELFMHFEFDDEEDKNLVFTIIDQIEGECEDDCR